MRRTLAAACGAVLIVAACAELLSAQAASPPPTISTVAGVYSAQQAARGEEVYKASCLECHVPSDYTGEAFTAKFVGGTAYDMFEQIRSTMPQSNPGSLTVQQYTDVVAYLFKLNDLPTREAEMSTEKDSLKAIKVEAKPPYRSTNGTRIPHGPSHIR